jgi:hypothetical protein
MIPVAILFYIIIFSMLACPCKLVETIRWPAVVSYCHQCLSCSSCTCSLPVALAFVSLGALLRLQLCGHIRRGTLFSVWSAAGGSSYRYQQASADQQA